MAFSKLGFQLLGNTTGLTITIVGTMDPQAYLAYTILGANEPIGQPFVSNFPTRTSVTVTAGSIVVTGMINTIYNTATIPSTSWVTAPGPSEQGGTGGSNNPITSAAPMFFSTTPFSSIRVVVSAVSTPTGSGSLVGFAIP